MAELNFLHNPDVLQNFSGTVSSNVITLASGTFDAGDVIYIPYSATGSVYAYCSNGPARTFVFNDEIYTGVPSSISTTSGKYWEVGDVIYDDVQSHRISSIIEKGLYSDAYITYKTSVDYKLIIPLKRREFFSETANKSVRSLLLANNVVFSDSCNQFAYGVGFEGSEFDTLNNKFKSSLEFNIALR